MGRVRRAWACCLYRARYGSSLTRAPIAAYVFFFFSFRYGSAHAKEDVSGVGAIGGKNLQEPWGVLGASQRRLEWRCLLVRVHWRVEARGLELVASDCGGTERSMCSCPRRGSGSGAVTVGVHRHPHIGSLRVHVRVASVGGLRSVHVLTVCVNERTFFGPKARLGGGIIYLGMQESNSRGTSGTSPRWWSHLDRRYLSSYQQGSRAAAAGEL
ncbi:hypothetical protein BKA93DRAFT_515976 [Sparassis latifolia]